MVAALPVAKLVFLGIRQVSKPIANILKKSATDHEFFSKNIIIPIGQGWHWMQVVVPRMSMQNMRTDVRRLSDKDAIALGAEIVGEVFIFTVAAVLLVNEYWQTSKKTAAKEEKVNQHLAQLSDELKHLQMSNESLHEHNKALHAAHEAASDSMNRMAEKLAAIEEHLKQRKLLPLPEGGEKQ
eukprot:m.19837 g.19837  ORF g.19837 m.19837 type:complete len:183 (-) comp8551_c0_seq1:158-706(-)